MLEWQAPNMDNNDKNSGAKEPISTNSLKLTK
jgi:hypothetical protein